MLRGLLSLPVFVAVALPALAQAPELEPKKLNLKAAAAPVPALKYRLLPEVRDLQPGNALICYMRALNPEFYPSAARGKQLQELDKLRELPFDEFKKTKKPGFGLPQLALEEVDRGARREYCDWEMLARLRKDGFSTPVPDVQIMRQFAFFLGYRARLELSKGEFDKAAYTVQTILALSRHLAEAPVLINELVGMALASIGLDQVEDFIQQPDAPNLYWALTGLPRPFIDIRKGLEGEKMMLEAEFPELIKLDRQPLSAEQFKRLANIGSNPNLMFKGTRDATFPEKLDLVGRVVQQYPAARKALIDQGREAEEVDALPMLQVVLSHNYQQFRRMQDDMEKWIFVPFWEAHKGRQQIDADHGNMVSAFPFAHVLPAVWRVYEASVRLDRRIAALRCIEALRLHLAETGKLPGSLDDITQVPIPIDPFTGKQFQYTARGDEVTLFGPPPPGVAAHENNVINYRITIKR